MGGDASRRDALLALALGSRRRKKERRLLPDRRSGVDRRRIAVEVSSERRSGCERRQTIIRRKDDRYEGTTLLEKARRRLVSGVTSKPNSPR
jgi:hypothetical protein